MSKTNKVIISAALSGAGTSRKSAPSVPITAQEIARDAVACVKAGAAVIHIHVRDDHEMGTMDTQKFAEAFEAVRESFQREQVDGIINLTTSGGYAPWETRLAHLKLLKPEICSFDAGSMNWANSYIFDNDPRFLEQLGALTQELDIKPEIEVFDASMIGNAKYYMKKGVLKAPPSFPVCPRCARRAGGQHRQRQLHAVQAARGGHLVHHRHRQEPSALSAGRAGRRS